MIGRLPLREIGRPDPHRPKKHAACIEAVRPNKLSELSRTKFENSKEHHWSVDRRLSTAAQVSTG